MDEIPKQSTSQMKNTSFLTEEIQKKEIHLDNENTSTCYDNLGFDSTEMAEKALDQAVGSGNKESLNVSLSPIIETNLECIQSNKIDEEPKPGSNESLTTTKPKLEEIVVSSPHAEPLLDCAEDSKEQDIVLDSEPEGLVDHTEKQINSQKTLSDEASSSIYNTALETSSLSSDRHSKVSSLANVQSNGSTVSSPRSSMYESALTNLSQAESDSTMPYRSINSSFDSSTLYHSVHSQEFSAHSSASLTSDTADNSENVDVGEDVTITDEPTPKQQEQIAHCQDKPPTSPLVTGEQVDSKGDQFLLRRTSLISDISSEGAVTDNMTDEDDDDELTDLLGKKTYRSAKSNANILDTSDESPKETDPFLWDKPCSPFEIICMDDLDGYQEYLDQQEQLCSGAAGLEEENEENLYATKEKGLAVIKEESFEMDDSEDICSVKFIKSGELNIISPKIMLGPDIKSESEPESYNATQTAEKDTPKVVPKHVSDNSLHQDTFVPEFGLPKECPTFQSQIASPQGALQPSELFSHELMHLSDSSAITTEDLLEELQGIHCGQVDPMVSSSHTLYDIETPSDETPELTSTLANRTSISNQKPKPLDGTSLKDEGLTLSGDVDEIPCKQSDVKIVRPRSVKSDVSDLEIPDDTRTSIVQKAKKSSIEQDNDERPSLTNQGSMEPELQCLIEYENEYDSNKMVEQQSISTVYPRPHSDSSADLHLDAELRASSRPESVPCNTDSNVGLLVLTNQESESLDRPVSPIPDDAFRIISDNSYHDISSTQKCEKLQSDVRNKVFNKKVGQNETLSKDLKDEINFGTMKTGIATPIQIPKQEMTQDLDEIASISSRGSLAEFEQMEKAINMAENIGKDSTFQEEGKLRKSSTSSLVAGSLSSLQEFERLEKEIISGSVTSLDNNYERQNEFEKCASTDIHKKILPTENGNQPKCTANGSTMAENLLPLRYKDKVQAVPEMSPISEPDVSMEQDSLSSPDTEKKKPLELVEEEEDMSIDCQSTEPNNGKDINFDIQRNNLRNFMISSIAKQSDTMMISADSLQDENRMTDSIDSLSPSIHDAMTGSVDSLEGNKVAKEGIDLHEIHINDAMVTSADSLEGQASQTQNLMMADSLDGTVAAQILKIEKQDSMIQSTDSLELNEAAERVEDEIEIDSLQGSYVDSKSANQQVSLQGSLSDSRCFDSLQESFTAEKRYNSNHHSFSEKITRDSLEGSAIEKIIATGDFSVDSLMSSNKNQTADPDSLGDIDTSQEKSERDSQTRNKKDDNLHNIKTVELDNGSIAGLGDKRMISHGKV